MNKLDADYPITKTNGFQLIMDENLQGTARYANLFPEECVSLD